MHLGHRWIYLENTFFHWEHRHGCELLSLLIFNISPVILLIVAIKNILLGYGIQGFYIYHLNL